MTKTAQVDTHVDASSSRVSSQKVSTKHAPGRTSSTEDAKAKSQSDGSSSIVSNVFSSAQQAVAGFSKLDPAASSARRRKRRFDTGSEEQQKQQQQQDTDSSVLVARKLEERRRKAKEFALKAQLEGLSSQRR